MSISRRLAGGRIVAAAAAAAAADADAADEDVG